MWPCCNLKLFFKAQHEQKTSQHAVEYDQRFQPIQLPAQQRVNDKIKTRLSKCVERNPSDYESCYTALFNAEYFWSWQYINRSKFYTTRTEMQLFRRSTVFFFDFKRTRFSFNFGRSLTAKAPVAKDSSISLMISKSRMRFDTWLISSIGTVENAFQTPSFWISKMWNRSVCKKLTSCSFFFECTNWCRPTRRPCASTRSTWSKSIQLRRW